MSIISARLTRDERIIWTGRPNPSRLLAPADAYLVPFSLLWLGFALFWEVGVLASILGGEGRGPEILFFPLFGLVFVLFGLYFAFGRLVVKARRRRRTHYAVTDRRVMEVQERGDGASVHAAFLDQIPAVSVQARGDGSGTLTFGTPTAGIWNMYADTGLEFFMGGMTGPLAFRDIPRVAEVAELIERARDEARGQRMSIASPNE